MFTQQQVLEKISTARKVSNDQYEVIFEKLKDRIEALGIPVREMDYDRTKFGWDGQVLSIPATNDYRRRVADLAHEFSHWLVCTPSRRKTPEFGLGAGFSTRDINGARKLRKVSTDSALKEEIATCFVAAFLLYEIGADVSGESYDVGIINDDGELSGKWAGDKARIKQAIRRGAINENLEIIWPEVA